MSDWWARRLASTTPPDTTPRQTSSLPPTSVPLKFPPATPSSPYPTTSQNVLDSSRHPQDEVTMGEAIRLWKGGEAARKQGDMTCPECGSAHVFARTAKGGNTMINGKPPAPRCFECGWNGLYDQGLQSSWAV